MNPAHILLFIFLIAVVPFLAGAFILAIFSILDDQIFPKLEDDEED